MSEQKITIIKPDIWSIIKIVGICLGLWFLYIIRDIILIVLVAGLLATIITPIVNYFERKKIPRWLGAFFVFVIIFLVLGLISWAVVPMAISQSKLFIEQVPVFLKSFLANASIETQVQFSGLLNQWLNTSPISGKAFFSLLGNVAGQIISFLMILIIAFYLSVRKKETRSRFGSLLPVKYKKLFSNFATSSQKEIGDWGRGMLILCLFVGVLTYIGLSVLGVKFALTLALIAGITELVPYIGPWLGGIPAVMIAFLASPTLALVVIILYIVVQQIQNILVTPYIMHKAVGLDPLVIIVILLIGGKIAGPLGMILAVPAATILSILFKEYLKYKEAIVKN